MEGPEREIAVWKRIMRQSNTSAASFHHLSDPLCCLLLPSDRLFCSSRNPRRKPFLHFNARARLIKELYIPMHLFPSRYTFLPLFPFYLSLIRRRGSRRGLNFMQIGS